MNDLAEFSFIQNIDIIILSLHFHNGDSRILRVKPNSWNPNMPFVNMADTMCFIVISILNSLAWSAKWCQMSLDIWSSFASSMRNAYSSNASCLISAITDTWDAHEFFFKKNVVCHSCDLLGDGCRIFDQRQYPVTIDDTIGEIRNILYYICIMTNARCSCYRTIHECARASCTSSMCIVTSSLADIQPSYWYQQRMIWSFVDDDCSICCQSYQYTIDSIYCNRTMYILVLDTKEASSWHRWIFSTCSSGVAYLIIWFWACATSPSDF